MEEICGTHGKRGYYPKNDVMFDNEMVVVYCICLYYRLASDLPFEVDWMVTRIVVRGSYSRALCSGCLVWDGDCVDVVQSKSPTFVPNKASFYSKLKKNN